MMEEIMEEFYAYGQQQARYPHTRLKQNNKF